MKTGVMTAREFLTGAGVARMRRAKDVEKLKTDADKARARLAVSIGKLADARLAMLGPWWREKFPRRELRIIFGNGTDHVSIDGRSYRLDQINRRDKLNWPMAVTCFDEIDEALADVDDITNGLRDGCPGDLVIERRRS